MFSNSGSAALEDAAFVVTGSFEVESASFVAELLVVLLLVPVLTELSVFAEIVSFDFGSCLFFDSVFPEFLVSADLLPLKKNHWRISFQGSCFREGFPCFPLIFLLYSVEYFFFFDN